MAAVSNRLQPGPAGGYSIAEHDLPSEGERALLVEREQRLTAAMLHGSREGDGAGGVHDVPRVPQRAHGGRSGENRGAVCVPSIACRDGRWIRAAGRPLSATPFPPSAGEFKALCEAVCEPVRTERGRINSILQADVYRLPDANERARVSAGFNKLKRTLLGRSGIRKGG